MGYVAVLAWRGRRAEQPDGRVGRERVAAQAGIVIGDLIVEIAELRVQLMNERDTTRSLQATTAATAEDLTAAHEIARGYLRELNQTKDDLQRARQEITKLRTKVTTTGNHQPASAAVT